MISDDRVKVFTVQKDAEKRIERRLMGDGTIIWLVPTIADKRRVSPYVQGQVFTFTDIQTNTTEYLNRRPIPKVAIINIEYLSKVRLCKIMYDVSKKGLLVDIYN